MTAHHCRGRSYPCRARGVPDDGGPATMGRDDGTRLQRRSPPAEAPSARVGSSCAVCIMFPCSSRGLAFPRYGAFRSSIVWCRLRYGTLPPTDGEPPAPSHPPGGSTSVPAQYVQPMPPHLSPSGTDPRPYSPDGLISTPRCASSWPVAPPRRQRRKTSTGHSPQRGMDG